MAIIQVYSRAKRIFYFYFYLLHSYYITMVDLIIFFYFLPVATDEI